MATATKQSMAVGGANRLTSLMQQFQTFRASVNDYVTQYNDANWSAVWDALPTAAANADGTFGTADASPNNAHPIDTRVVSGLSAAMAANDMVNAVALLEALQAFLTNQAVATANRNAVIDLFQQG